MVKSYRTWKAGMKMEGLVLVRAWERVLHNNKQRLSLIEVQRAKTSKRNWRRCIALCASVFRSKELVSSHLISTSNLFHLRNGDKIFDCLLHFLENIRYLNQQIKMKNIIRKMRLNLCWLVKHNTYTLSCNDHSVFS